MTDLTYRRAESSDVPFIANLERLSFAAPWTRERIKAERHQWHAACWIVESGPQPVAYVFWRQEPRSLDVVRMAVAIQYRREGIGTGILRRVVSKLHGKRRTLRMLVGIDDVVAMRCAAAAGMQARLMRRPDGGPATSVLMYLCQSAEVLRRSCR